MTKSKYKEWLKYGGLTENEVPYLTLYGTGSKCKVGDSRTFIDNEGYYHVYPLGFNECSLLIVCPHCGEIHLHGAGQGPNYKDYAGHRTKHENGYIIEELKKLIGGESKCKQ